MSAAESIQEFIKVGRKKEQFDLDLGSVCTCCFLVYLLFHQERWPKSPEVWITSFTAPNLALSAQRSPLDVP